VPFPTPIPGLVIRYSYFWRSEYLRGQEEGVKDRPCAVLPAITDEAGDQKVIVLPARSVDQPVAGCSFDEFEPGLAEQFLYFGFGPVVDGSSLCRPDRSDFAHTSYCPRNATKQPSKCRVVTITMDK
jgi:hypothetical protein